MIREIVEDHGPALTRAVSPLRQNALMRQREIAAGADGHNVDADLGDFRGILWDLEGEDQAARAIELEILADVFNVGIVAPNQKKLAADAAVNLHTSHLSGWCSEQPSARSRGIQPGIKDALRSGIEVARNAQYTVGINGHFEFPFRSSSLRRASSASRRLFQKRS